MARKSLREDILNATEAVIMRQGLANTTLEAVALEAGVSKGGLFYHFTSKKDLLLSLLDRYEARFIATRARMMEELPEGPARFLKATILAALDHPRPAKHKASNLLSLLDDVDLRDKIAGLKKKTYDDVIVGTPQPERTALALLAVDGLWVAEMFGKPVLDEPFRKRIIEALMAVIDELSEGFTAAENGGEGNSGED